MYYAVFYKHIVPTGLKTVQRKRNVLKHPVYVKLYLTFSYLAQLVIIKGLYQTKKQRISTYFGATSYKLGLQTLQQMIGGNLGYHNKLSSKNAISGRMGFISILSKL